MRCISLKTKGNFGRKEPFQNLYLQKQPSTVAVITPALKGLQLDNSLNATLL